MLDEPPLIVKIGVDFNIPHLICKFIYSVKKRRECTPTLFRLLYLSLFYKVISRKILKLIQLISQLALVHIVCF